jgi:hypothetical protein
MTLKALDVVPVTGLCAAGVAFRAPGLTAANLWFDDAWAALPSHLSFSTALHMVVTAPLYGLALRSWMQLGPQATWWDQLPAFVLGVAGIVAVYALVRGLGLPRLGAFAAGLAIAVGPVTIAYSTRLKEYPSDLLFACLVLWLAERWRRAPSRSATLALAAAGVVSLWVSASTAAVVGGAAAVVVVTSLGRRELRREAVLLVGALAAGTIGVWAVFLRLVPSQLRTNWRTHGYLFGYADVHHVLYEFQQTFSGLTHGLLGVPIPWTSSGSALRPVPMIFAVASFVGIVAIVVVPIRAAARARWRDVGPGFAAAVAVAIAILGTLIGAAPLGDGRTDEALYPALLVLLVVAATLLATAATSPERVTRRVRFGVAAAMGLVSVLFGAAHVAEYPPTGLTSVVAELKTHLLPGDVVVVDGYEAFTWADEDLGAWHVSLRQGSVPWPMGFHVVSDNPIYVLSDEYLQSDRQIDNLSLRTHRLWYVGPTVGGFSNAAPSDLWSFPYSTPIYNELSMLGWRPVGGVCCHAPGVYAVLFLYKSNTS